MKTFPGLDADLTPEARAVMRAFADAQTRAVAFLLHSGVFPEVSESGSDGLLNIIRDLSSRHLNQKSRARELRTSLARHSRSREGRDQIEGAVNAVLANETTAAYLFGLAAGLSLTSLGDSLKR